MNDHERAEARLAEVQDILDAEPHEGKKKKSQATILVELCEDLDLFHDDDQGYAAVAVNGRRETWALRSRAMRHLLARRYYLAARAAPGGQAVEDALRVLTGRALHEGDGRRVHTRIAESGCNIYVDMCDPSWRAIEVTAAGWGIVERPPVHFVRRRGMETLPAPTPGGSVEHLRELLNVTEDADYRRIVAWLVQALRPRGPYPVLVLSGEQGSAKSTCARMLRALVDPSVAPIRTMPRDERDLIIAARNGWMIALDNLSGLAPWLSDALCRLSTGGGFSARELYSDADEILIDVTRPVAVNGIDAIATRPDLADRAIVVTLDPIPDARRRPEADLWRDFTAAAPGILGGLLDAVACALAGIDGVRLLRLPRMADHATWIEAASPALGWPPGVYVAEHVEARDQIVAAAADASPVAAAVMALIDRVGQWRGTASDLLDELTAAAEPAQSRAKYWPSSPVAMGNAITRLAPALRARGYTVERPPGRTHGRQIMLGQLGDRPSYPSSPVLPSCATGSAEDTCEDSRTAQDGQDGRFPTCPNSHRRVPV